MKLNREQAMDILDKFDFFQGQRAGRELWAEKPFEVQEEDLKNFSKDVASLKTFIKELAEENESLGALNEHNDLVIEGKLERISALERTVLKLTEENERLREDKERVTSTYYEAMCELKNRITCQVVLSDEKLEEIKTECLKRIELDIKAIQTDTVREFAERLHEQFRESVAYTRSYIHDDIDQIAKEMTEGV